VVLGPGAESRRDPGLIQIEHAEVGGAAAGQPLGHATEVALVRRDGVASLALDLQARVKSSIASDNISPERITRVSNITLPQEIGELVESMTDVRAAFEQITAAVRDGRSLGEIVNELTQVTLYVMRCEDGSGPSADGRDSGAPAAVLQRSPIDVAGIADPHLQTVFNGWARMTMTALERAEAAETKCEQLEQAVASRDVIGQAKGILMERHKLTPDAAFDMLRQASQHLNIKLRDVATTLADTGELPKG
jgi:hypothetical protein